MALCQHNLPINSFSAYSSYKTSRTNGFMSCRIASLASWLVLLFRNKYIYTFFLEEQYLFKNVQFGIMNAEHLFYLVILIYLFSVFFLFKEGRCNDMTSASTDVRKH